MSDISSDAVTQAQRLWEKGTHHMLSGDVREAIRLYEQSLAVQPTAEGYTFRGWAIAYLGRLDEAIENCKKAIRLDPDFGNPYNDIGVYLMQQGKLDEAIPWLEQAKQAPRYDPRHFPYVNLGRIYAAKEDPMRALDEFVAALDLQPDDKGALEGLGKLEYPVH